MTFRTRFAPSPTGPLHLGHAYSALLAYDLAQTQGGEFLLRIEDIDQSRARPEWEQQIYDDLEWLGLSWTTPVSRQSDRLNVYQETLTDLWRRELVYQCHCNRKDILAAASAPQEGGEPILGPDGIIYPGTCRSNTSLHDTIAFPENAALRLNMSVAAANSRLSFTERGEGPNGETGLIEFSADDLTGSIGDVVLARRDIGTSYHLSVVLDDASQGISHVVRGHDLFEATKIHVALQQLLDLPTPVYHHHKLIRDDAGKRLAKRDDARALSKYRADGYTPDDIRRMTGLPV
ncbi:tRNA glutamyl-Q(34) synthetase GluQRS [Litoreibacter halocynthiae]|uniref:tRNA glutamyl-Q(34) synthetase GluQRS n=1 Tax=Litoreibacter halocynthiae TaxID=1242689 RepID=UPI00249010CB|nr:tRNA glutamyl-Q(34) synthetase GluQRS [Litoreibacter halocynthiae]